MTQEEKAKAYDELLDKAKQIYNKENDVIIKCIIEGLFPELKESEDERIRKELIEFVKSRGGFKQEYIAWLEKQSEQKLPIEKLPSEMKNIGESLGFTTQEECDRYNQMVTDLIMSDNDKVEPKFKKGQWIVFNGLTLYVKEVVKGFYRTVSKGGIPNSYDWDIDNVARLWTIQDAKDGDVLVDEEINVIGIFDGIEGMCWHSKFYYSNITKEFYGIECGGSHLKKFAKPATKEQHDTLMKAMSDAGYTFDFEKKELRKIEQKKEDISELTEFEAELFSMMSDAWQGYLHGEEVNIAKIVKEHSSELLERANKQKPTWSKEDEYYYGVIQYILNNEYVGKTDKENAIKWFNSLKDRVQPQPRQEWSEEDETALGDALWCCKQAASIAKDENDMGNVWYAEHWLKSLKDRYVLQPKHEWSEEDDIMVENIRNSFGLHCGQMTEALKKQYDKFFNKVKSLRPQSTWKPSELQIEALESATENCAYSEYQDCLRELIEQLKK